MYNHVKVEVLIPETYIEKLRNALNHHGILTIGNYDHVISYTRVHGYWRPLEEAAPYEGEKGKVSHGTECQVTFKATRHQLHMVKHIIRDIHPYEEPVYYLIPLID